jgi:hypothetical protein
MTKSEWRMTMASERHFRHSFIGSAMARPCREERAGGSIVILVSPFVISNKWRIFVRLRREKGCAGFSS